MDLEMRSFCLGPLGLNSKAESITVFSFGETLFCETQVFAITLLIVGAGSGFWTRFGK